MTTSATRLALAALALLLGACSLLGTAGDSPPEPYQPNRIDYAAFRAVHPELLEPNYLPFMVHRIPHVDSEDILVYCRWPTDAMPLGAYIEVPVISESLQDEFDPKESAAYVAAVERALATWERELEGLVRFESVAEPGEADLRIQLVAEVAEERRPGHRVLGETPRECRALGWEQEPERLRVRFAVPELRVFIADDFGLLDPDQVEWIALHEIGHALGMRSHSPLPADLMYRVVRDRIAVAGLSVEDLNSFVSLYRMPDGTVFKRLGREGWALPPPLPSPRRPPRLALAPHVDSRLGFEVRLPEGWTRIETPYGVAAVDGVTWDVYDASFQVNVMRYPTIDAYLQRYRAHYLSGGRLIGRAELVVGGRRALQLTLQNLERDFVEEITFIEAGDGRVIVIIADCGAESLETYRPWFRATLASLDIWPAAGRGGVEP